MAAPPPAPGLQNAVVVGLANESLTTDRDLRVKVQFPWQRDGRHAGPVNGQPESKAGDDGRTPDTDPVESFARPQLVPHSGQHPALGQPRLMTPKAFYDAAAQGIDIFLGWEDEGSIRNATPPSTVGDGKELSHTWVVRKIGQARITAVRGQRREPYFEQHLEGGFGFYGYWSWEAAAVTWLLGIDDTSYRSMRFYPVDLADFAKAFPPPGAGTTTAAALRCDAGQPCPREGWWSTPAKADSRRRFKLGELMPDFKTDYGTVIWQWDDQQTS